MDIKGLQNANRYEDLFILARYLYRIGRPIMNDTDYDKLEKHLDSMEYCQII